jgi:hypothetical protein
VCDCNVSRGRCSSLSLSRLTVLFILDFQTSPSPHESRGEGLVWDSRGEGLVWKTRMKRTVTNSSLEASGCSTCEWQNIYIYYYTRTDARTQGAEGQALISIDWDLLITSRFLKFKVLKSGLKVLRVQSSIRSRVGVHVFSSTTQHSLCVVCVCVCVCVWCVCVCARACLSVRVEIIVVYWESCVVLSTCNLTPCSIRQ